MGSDLLLPRRDLPRTHPPSLPALLLSFKTPLPGITEVALADRNTFRSQTGRAVQLQAPVPSGAAATWGRTVLFDSPGRGGDSHNFYLGWTRGIFKQLYKWPGPSRLGAGGCVRTDSRHTGWVDSSTRSYLPKLFSETLSAGFAACTLDCFIRRHFPLANWTASGSGFSVRWAVGRDKEFSGVTGNFCPEDPETRIAEGWECAASLNECWGRGLASVRWAACYSWMSLSSFQVGHRLLFCGLISPLPCFLLPLAFLLQTIHLPARVLEHPTQWLTKCIRNPDSSVGLRF